MARGKARGRTAELAQPKHSWADPAGVRRHALLRIPGGCSGKPQAAGVSLRGGHTDRDG